MAAPTFVQAGAGRVNTSGTFGDSLSGVTVGNVIISQAIVDGADDNDPLDSTGQSGIESLAGTANSWTLIGNFDVGGSAEARMWLYIGRATATTVGDQYDTAQVGGQDIYNRLYEFSGVHTGTALADVIENGSAGSTTTSAGTSNTIADASVQTLGADRLALNFVAINDDNALDAFTGQSGGTWAEAVAEFASSTGTDAAIQLQTATIASAGTIDGGTEGMAASDAWGVVGFALKPQAAAVPASLLYVPRPMIRNI